LGIIPTGPGSDPEAGPGGPTGPHPEPGAGHPEALARWGRQV